MRKIKKLFAMMMTLVMTLGIITTNISAIEELKVTSIVANTYVGDGQREVSSFEITVNDINLVNDLKAEDFDITNNVSSVPYDVATNALADDYLDDGISLEIKEIQLFLM